MYHRKHVYRSCGKTQKLQGSVNQNHSTGSKKMISLEQQVIVFSLGKVVALDHLYRIIPIPLPTRIVTQTLYHCDNIIFVEALTIFAGSRKKGIQAIAHDTIHTRPHL